MSTSTGTEIQKSPLGGRGLFATADHSAGDVLLALDRPLVAVLDKQRVEDTCSWCFSWTELPVLSGAGINQAAKVNWCTGCKKVKYCSRRCQSQAWKAIHKRECKDLAAQSDIMPNTVIALIQIMEALSTGDKNYSAILEMDAHRDDFEKAGGQKWEAMELMVRSALTVMQKKGIKVQGESAKMAMCVLMCNSSRLVTPTFDPLGLTLDPQAATVNHSCSPNAVVVFDGPKLSVRALDPIRKGEEVLISYIDCTAPLGVRQAELQDQYFFTCNCKKCKLGTAAPQDAFLDPGPDFEERSKVLDDMIPQLVKDPAWPRHVLGSSKHEQRLSALQFHGYAQLESPYAENKAEDVAHFRKTIHILRNTSMWPLSRAPLPALYQQYAVACMSAKRYNEALVAMVRIFVLIDPVIYPQPHHPVRVVHAWTLATLATAIGSDPDTPFCKALQSVGVDLSMLFVGLLLDMREQVDRSHGSESLFGQMVGNALQAIMEPGGGLDMQYQQMGVKRDQWPKLLEEQIEELWPKVRAFADDESISAEIDQALAA